MNRVSLMGARLSLAYLTVVSALGYVFPVGVVTPIRVILDVFLLLAVVCAFMRKPVFRITAAVAGVVVVAGSFHVMGPFLRFAFSGVGSISILIGPWEVPGMTGILLVVIPEVLTFAFCVLMLFYAERDLGKSES